jgi:formylglycine-generating enzyme required for sulfatase activity
MTAPVGSFAPNPFGLHDTVGNVWEWVADPWHDNYINAPTEARLWDEQGENKRLLRGGSWLNLPNDCRASDRVGASPNNRDGFVGFRVALAEWKI